MFHPDPVLARADIASLAGHFPHLERMTIDALYRHYLATHDRQPAFDEIRAYVAHVTGSLHEEALWDLLFVPATETPEPPDRTRAHEPPARSRARRPGRPGWTPETFWARYEAACALVAPPHTYRSLAPRFETLDGSLGIDPDHLRKLLVRFGPPPSPAPVENPG